ncbi:MAG TPA: FHA domain-containing protein, partial [Agriterribacter sp.]|nr:FHA domain-containing protein [Agriterribacter sp.]
MNAQNPTTVLIRYMDGKNKGQTEKFTVTPTLNITIGRGDANQIAFDPANDIISRQHCHIRVHPQVPDTYEITDLQSKNGTYVNGHIITGTTTLMAGDTIRLGKEGPLLAFDLDPRPASHIKKTRVVDAVDASSKDTKLHHNAPTAANATPAKETIGKHTMQHMIA